MTVLDDLRVTREALLERGWHQGSVENGLGNVCLMGALNIACFGTAWPSSEQLDNDTRRMPAYYALRAHLLPGRPDYDVADFNDDHSTGLEDVLSLVDRTMADVS